jgi:hypothetical protein
MSAVEGRFLPDFTCVECDQRGAGVAIVMLGEAPVCFDCIVGFIDDGAHERPPGGPIARTLRD